MKIDNIFKNIPTNLDEELFQDIIAKDGVKIQRIVSQAHTTPEGEWYKQVENEWVLVLSGSAIISFESDNDIKLEKGDHLNIPAHKRHRVSWTSEDEKTVWLVVFY